MVYQNLYNYPLDIMKRVFLRLAFSVFSLLIMSSGFCQDNTWIVGIWRGFHFVDKAYSPYYIDQLEVIKVKGKYFYGVSHIFAPEDSLIKISYQIRGTFFKDYISIKQLKIIEANHRNGKIKWPNTCTECKPIEYSISRTADSVVLTGERNFCYSYCNGKYNLSKSLTVTDKSKQNNTNIKDSFKNDSLDSLPKNSIFMRREVKKNSTLKVDTDTVEVRLMDSGIIDDDSATLILNGKPIAENVKLSANALIYKIVLLKDQPNNLVLLAKNLGSIPPNTAFVEILYSGKKYSIHLASDFTTSSSIELIYEVK